MATGSTRYYPLVDGQGSVMKTTDGGGNVVNTYTYYDAYGKTRSQTGTQPNTTRFAGEQTDDSTGLQYLRARYYDMETGRFISRDPMAHSPSWLANPFGYTTGNPVNATDPSGLFTYFDSGNTGMACDIDPLSGPAVCVDIGAKWVDWFGGWVRESVGLYFDGANWVPLPDNYPYSRPTFQPPDGGTGSFVSTDGADCAGTWDPAYHTCYVPPTEAEVARDLLGEDFSIRTGRTQDGLERSVPGAISRGMSPRPIASRPTDMFVGIGYEFRFSSTSGVRVCVTVFIFNC